MLLNSKVILQMLYGSSAVFHFISQKVAFEGFFEDFLTFEIYIPFFILPWEYPSMEKSSEDEQYVCLFSEASHLKSLFQKLL